jgi:uncharacterized membrane protein
MSRRTTLLALVVGAGVFFAVGLSVTALLADRIYFSVFVGFPVGLVSGVLAAIGVTLWAGADTRAERSRVLWTGGGFLGGFLATLGILAGPVGTGVVVSLAAALVAGLTLGLWGYTRRAGSS